MLIPAQPMSRLFGATKLGIARLTAILIWVAACPVYANCDQPAYQQCRHLQADVEGMARAGDARYLGRSFGNKDIQCTTRADIDAAKEMIESCASRGEWTSSIQVGEAQSLLVQINQKRIPVVTPENDPARLPKDGSPTVDSGAEQGSVSSAESSTVDLHSSDTSSKQVVPIDVPVQSGVDAPPLPNPAVTTQVSSSSAVAEASKQDVKASVPTDSVHKSRDWSPLFWGIAIAWLAIVVAGVIAGWNEKIVVFRNFDDLAMMFFMLVIPLCLVWIGDYGAMLATLAFSCLLVWVSIRTWKDQSPRSIWAFCLALITKLSLGILFVNSLWSAISPGGKTQLARARTRASAIAMLALLSPIVLRLVRDHEGIWSPRHLLSPYHRRRAGI